MLTAVAMVLLASALLGVLGRRLARVLPPATTVRGFSLAAFVMALTTGFVLTVMCFNFLAQIPVVAGAGRWSLSSLRSRELVPNSLGLAACLTLAVVTVVVIRRACGVVADLWAADVARRKLGRQATQLLVIDDSRPHAYALPGFVAGRIVVSTGMLAALDSDERRVLLAHEAAHLKHRHHVYVALSQLAAAANPLLRSIPDVVRTSVERWADEDAAAAIGDRRTTARAIAKASLVTAASRPQSGGATALAMAQGPAVARTAALLRPPPRPHRLMVASALTGVLLLALSTSAVAAHLTEHRFEVAHAVYVAG